MEPRPILDPKLRCARSRHLGRSCRIDGRSGVTPVPQLNASWHGAFALRLQRGEVQGYDVNRMVFEFTMLNPGEVLLCAVSTAAMHDLDGRRDVKSDQRADQFIRLRDAVEQRASHKFFEEQAQVDRPVVLRSIDFR